MLNSFARPGLSIESMTSEETNRHFSGLINEVKKEVEEIQRKLVGGGVIVNYGKRLGVDVSINLSEIVKKINGSTTALGGQSANYVLFGGSDGTSTQDKDLSWDNTDKILTAKNFVSESVDSDELVLSAGATINEISTDGTLSGDSDTAVPTEKAVKTYMDVVEATAVLIDGTRELTANWDAGSYRITSNSIDTNTYYYMGGNKAINIDGTDSISIGTGILGGAAYSTHIGINSGRISIGLYNVGISANSLYNVYNGAYNVAIAGAALYSLVSGVYNIAIGTTSQYFNVSGGYNTSIGTNALRNVLSSYNTGICLSALQNLQYGTNNTGIGINVFYSLGIGYYNVGIGDAAGYYLSTTSDRNTLIGYAAGLGTTSYVASGMIKIGYYAGANDNNSNRLYIHNANSGNTGALIYGEFNTTVASQLLRINGVLELPIIKTGATQASAGATVNEIWKTSGHATLPDNVVLCGV